MSQSPISGEMPAEVIEKWAQEFDEMTNTRLQVGMEKYGEFTWLEAPTFDMMVEELADMVNYARFTAVKIRLIQSWLAGALDDHMSSGFAPSNPERDQ